MSVVANIPGLLPASCHPWCTFPHGPGLLRAHGRTVAVIAARHAEISVLVEQTGDHQPMLALSVDVPDPVPGTAGFTHVVAAQARELRDALIVAVDLLHASRPEST